MKLLSDFECDEGICTIDVTDKIPPCSAFSLIYFPNIIELDITGMVELNAQDMVECISYARKLQFVTMDKCKQFNKYHFIKIFDELPECKWILLLQCQSLDYTTAYCILSSCNKMKFFDFEVDQKWSCKSDWRKLLSIFLNVRFGRRMLLCSKK